MKLLCTLSPQHCSIKDDTIIFYQLTKNADKLWFNKMQSALRGAAVLLSGAIAHEAALAPKARSPHNKGQQKKKEKKKKRCDDIRSKE